MTFVKIEKPVEEGEKSECAYCGMSLISRLTDYKGKFPEQDLVSGLLKG